MVSAPSFSVTATDYITTHDPAWSFLTIQFNTPIALEKSNQAISNYYDSFSEIRMDFFQLNGVNAHFSYDLGYGATATEVDCWNCEDLIPYRPSLSCKLIKGSTATPTASDKAVVRIMNYKA